MGMKFMSILLSEGRKEKIKEKYIDWVDENVLNDILKNPFLEKTNHKYSDFVVKSVIADQSPSDVDKIIDMLQLFDKYHSQISKKDINQYFNVAELQDTIEPFIKKEKEKELESQVDKVYEDNKFLVVKPKTEESTCKYGANTRWCVTQRGKGYFERYTQGLQGLYFIIDKENSTNENFSKIAIHYDENGDERFFDSQDNFLAKREIDILTYAFPNVIENVRKHYEKYRINEINLFLEECFDEKTEYTKIIENYANSNKTLLITVEGFSNAHEMGTGHAEGILEIKLQDKGTLTTVDSYIIYVMYGSKNLRLFNGYIEFVGYSEDNKVDLDLESHGTNILSYVRDDIVSTMDEFSKRVVEYVYQQIRYSSNLIQFFHGGNKVWRPNPFYGYKFGKNKGLIRKLIDRLDKRDDFTKLDFLVSIGKVDKTVEDGEILYKPSTQTEWRTAPQMRGYFSSFFAQAKNAGIITYERKGRDYIIKKGENFDSFKKGELKAL